MPTVGVSGMTVTTATGAVNIFVAGKPLGQPRPRATSIGGFIRMYTPKKAKVWKDTIAAQVGAVSIPEGPLHSTLIFVMPRPKSHLGTGKNAGIVKASAPKHHIAKPDLDNLIKPSWDSALPEDSRVVSCNATKRYADTGEPSGVHITFCPPCDDTPAR